MKDFSVGVGKRNISPPLGIELCGYGIYRGRKNKGVHDNLYSRALALSNGDENIIIITNDLVGVSQEIQKETETLISKELGIREDNVIITSTHTHSGPATVPLKGWGEIDEDYVKSLPEKFLESASSAYNNLREAKYGFGRADVKRVSINRVIRGGPVDREVRVLHFKDKDLKPLATLFNYSCHGVAIDVRTDDGFYVSSDWPGYAMRFVEKNGGGHAYFLQGTCGDINPLVTWHMRGFDAAEETGRKVANGVLRVLSEIEVKDCKELMIEKKIFKLPFQKMTMKKIVDDLIEFLDQLEVREKASIEELRPSIRFYREYAIDMIEKMEKGFPDGLESRIQVVVLDETALIFVPGEVFIELGLDIMKRSPFKNTMVVGYSGYLVGYIPTALDYTMKGYASTMVPKIFRYPPFIKDIGSVLVKESLSLLQNAYMKKHQ